MTTLFWWSPMRMRPLLRQELKFNGAGWARFVAASRAPIRNFGDELAPLAFEFATGRKPVWAPAPEADVVGIGSILEFYFYCGGESAQVWGTGFRDAAAIPDWMRLKIERLGKIHAVRGPATAAALGGTSNVPFGDPGVLAYALPRRPQRRRAKVFLPHFRTWMSQTGRAELRAADRAGFSIVAPNTDPRTVIGSIESADLVVTSCLHGLIVGHSVGTPTQLVDIPSSGNDEPTFKYNDYLDTVGLPLDRLPARDAFNTHPPRQLIDKLEPLVAPAQGACSRMGDGLDAAVRGL